MPLPHRTPMGARPPCLSSRPATRAASARSAAAALVLLGAACADGGARKPPPRLAQGDSVQITVRELGPGWHAGTVGQAGDCTALMVPDPSPPAPPVRFVVVAFDSVTALRRGGEDLPIEPLREAYGDCSPF